MDKGREGRAGDAISTYSLESMHHVEDGFRVGKEVGKDSSEQEEALTLPKLVAGSSAKEVVSRRASASSVSKLPAIGPARRDAVAASRSDLAFVRSTESREDTIESSEGHPNAQSTPIKDGKSILRSPSAAAEAMKLFRSNHRPTPSRLGRGGVVPPIRPNFSDDVVVSSESSQHEAVREVLDDSLNKLKEKEDLIADLKRRIKELERAELLVIDGREVDPVSLDKNQLLSALDSAWKEVQRLRAQLLTMKEKQDQQEAVFARMINKQVDRDKQALEESFARNEQDEKEISRLEILNKDLSKKVRSLEADLQRSKTNFEEVCQKIDFYEQENLRLAKEGDKIKGENKELKEENKQAKEESEVVATKNEELEKDLEKAKKNLEDLKGKLSEQEILSQEETDKLQDSLKAKDAELSEAKQELQTLRNELDQGRSKRPASLAESDDGDQEALRKRIVELEEALKVKAAETVKSGAVDPRREKDAGGVSLTALQGQLDKLRLDLKNKEEEDRVYKSEVVAVRRDLEGRIAKIEDEKRRLEEALKDAEKNKSARDEAMAQLVEQFESFEETAKLNRSKKTLRSDLESLTNRLKKLQDKFQEQLNSNADLQRELESQTQLNRSLIEEHQAELQVIEGKKQKKEAELRNKIQDLKADKELGEKNLKKSNEKIEELKNQIQELQVALKEKESAIKTIEDENARLKTEKTSLEEAVRAQKGEIDKLTKVVDANIAEINELKEQSEKDKADLERKRQEIADLGAKNKQLESELGARGDEVGNLKEKLAEATGNLEAQKEQLEEQQAEIDALKQDVQGKEKGVADLNKKLAAEKEKNEALIEEKKALATQYEESLQAIAGNSDAATTTLNQELEEKNKTIADQATKIGSLEEKIGRLESEKASLDTQLRVLQTEQERSLESFKKDKKQLEDANAELQAKLDEALKQLEDNKKEFEAAKLRYENEANDLRGKVDEASKAKADADSTMENAAKQLLLLQDALRKELNKGGAPNLEDDSRIDDPRDVEIKTLSELVRNLQLLLQEERKRLADIEEAAAKKRWPFGGSKKSTALEQGDAQAIEAFNKRVNELTNELDLLRGEAKKKTPVAVHIGQDTEDLVQKLKESMLELHEKNQKVIDLSAELAAVKAKLEDGERERGDEKIRFESEKSELEEANKGLQNEAEKLRGKLLDLEAVESERNLAKDELVREKEENAKLRKTLDDLAKASQTGDASEASLALLERMGSLEKSLAKKEVGLGVKDAVIKRLNEEAGVKDIQIKGLANENAELRSELDRYIANLEKLNLRIENASEWNAQNIAKKERRIKELEQRIEELEQQPTESRSAEPSSVVKSGKGSFFGRLGRGFVGGLRVFTRRSRKGSAEELESLLPPSDDSAPHAAGGDSVREEEIDRLKAELAQSKAELEDSRLRFFVANYEVEVLRNQLLAQQGATTAFMQQTAAAIPAPVMIATGIDPKLVIGQRLSRLYSHLVNTYKAKDQQHPYADLDKSAVISGVEHNIYKIDLPAVEGRTNSAVTLGVSRTDIGQLWFLRKDEKGEWINVEPNYMDDLLKRAEDSMIGKGGEIVNELLDLRGRNLQLEDRQSSLQEENDRLREEMEEMRRGGSAEKRVGDGAEIVRGRDSALGGDHASKKVTELSEAKKQNYDEVLARAAPIIHAYNPGGREELKGEFSKLSEDFQFNSKKADLNSFKKALQKVNDGDSADQILARRSIDIPLHAQLRLNPTNLFVVGDKISFKHLDTIVKAMPNQKQFIEDLKQKITNVFGAEGSNFSVSTDKDKKLSAQEVYSLIRGDGKNNIISLVQKHNDSVINSVELRCLIAIGLSLDKEEGVLKKESGKENRIAQVDYFGVDAIEGYRKKLLDDGKETGPSLLKTALENALKAIKKDGRVEELMSFTVAKQKAAPSTSPSPSSASAGALDSKAKMLLSDGRGGLSKA